MRLIPRRDPHEVVKTRTDHENYIRFYTLIQVSACQQSLWRHSVTERRRSVFGWKSADSSPSSAFSLFTSSVLIHVGLKSLPGSGLQITAAGGNGGRVLPEEVMSEEQLGFGDKLCACCCPLGKDCRGWLITSIDPLKTISTLVLREETAAGPQPRASRLCPSRLWTFVTSEARGPQWRCRAFLPSVTSSLSFSGSVLL